MLMKFKVVTSSDDPKTYYTNAFGEAPDARQLPKNTYRRDSVNGMAL